MTFIVVLILTAISLASTAAYFSIVGLAAVFSGLFWPVIVMGSVVEAGKLVAVSFLYRYWHRLKVSRVYFIAGIVVAMVVTSGGIFGLLAQGYQSDTLSLKQSGLQIELLTEQKEEFGTLKLERLERKREIDTIIASPPDTYITAKERLVKQFTPELEQLKKDIKQYTDDILKASLDINKLKNENVAEEVHIGPIVFIAKAVNMPIDDATKWLIFLIIFIFDPMAVALTFAANVAILEHSGGRKQFIKQTNDSEPSIEYHDEHMESPIIIHQGMDADELQAILDKRFSKYDQLSPEQQMQKSLIEETLAKKKVTQKIRGG